MSFWKSAWPLTGSFPSLLKVCTNRAAKLSTYLIAYIGADNPQNSIFHSLWEREKPIFLHRQASTMTPVAPRRLYLDVFSAYDETVLQTRRAIRGAWLVSVYFESRFLFLLWWKVRHCSLYDPFIFVTWTYGNRLNYFNVFTKTAAQRHG